MATSLQKLRDHFPWRCLVFCCLASLKSTPLNSTKGQKVVDFGKARKDGEGGHGAGRVFRKTDNSCDDFEKGLSLRRRTSARPGSPKRGPATVFSATQTDEVESTKNNGICTFDGKLDFEIGRAGRGDAKSRARLNFLVYGFDPKGIFQLLSLVPGVSSSSTSPDILFGIRSNYLQRHQFLV